MTNFPPTPNSPEMQLNVLETMQKHRKSMLTYSVTLGDQISLLTPTVTTKRLREELAAVETSLRTMQGLVQRAYNETYERQQKRKRGDAA